MESVASLIFNVENVRMLVLLVFGFCGYVLIRSQMKSLEYSLNNKIDGVESSLGKRIDALDKKIDGVESSLNKRIDSLDSRIDEKIAAANQNLYAQLKANDFKHLNDTIEALTFTLEKNGFLKREDKEYIDGRLDK
jgi:hypothetical protein